MKTINYILLLTSIIFTYACKKIEPPMDITQANDPIYLLEGLINNDSIKLYVNDTTVFISNAPYNMNGVEAYSSTINDVESGFELKMIVLKPEIILSENGLKLINETNTNYIVHKNICKAFSFSNGSNQGNYTNIELNDKKVIGNQLELTEYGKYDLKFNFNNINNKTYVLPVEFGFKDEILNPYFKILGLDHNKIVVHSNNTSISSRWLIDGNEISSELNDTLEIGDGIHKISHTVTDNNNNSATHSTLVNIHNSLIWEMSQTYCSEDIIENNYGNIIIEVKKNGTEYTSAYNSKNLTNNLKINNIEYILDASLQSIKFIKFNVSFDAELKNYDNSKTLNLKNMKGTFHIKIN